MQSIPIFSIIILVLVIIAGIISIVTFSVPTLPAKWVDNKIIIGSSLLVFSVALAVIAGWGIANGI